MRRAGRPTFHPRHVEIRIMPKICQRMLPNVRRPHHHGKEHRRITRHQNPPQTPLLKGPVSPDPPWFPQSFPCIFLTQKDPSDQKSSQRKEKEQPDLKRERPTPLLRCPVMPHHANHPDGPPTVQLYVPLRLQVSRKFPLPSPDRQAKLTDEKLFWFSKLRKRYQQLAPVRAFFLADSASSALVHRPLVVCRRSK